MIDVTRDTVLPFAEARAWLGDRLGTTPSVLTLRRWMSVGVKGVVLESFLVGSRRFTSEEAIIRFIAARSGTTVTPSARRRREIARAGRECDRIFGGVRGGK